MSWTFEDVCRQVARTPDFPVTCSRVGRWWYDELEVDVVGVNDHTETRLLGECKWTTDPVGGDLLATLESLESEVRWRGADRSVASVLFAKSGFTTELRKSTRDRDGVSLFTVDDVLGSF